MRFVPPSSPMVLQVDLAEMRKVPGIDKTWNEAINEAMQSEEGITPFLKSLGPDPLRQVDSITFAADGDSKKGEEPGALVIIDGLITLEQIVTAARSPEVKNLRVLEFKAGPLAGYQFETARPEPKKSFGAAAPRPSAYESEAEKAKSIYLVSMNGMLIGATSRALLLRALLAKTSHESADDAGFYRDKKRSIHGSPHVVFLMDGANASRLSSLPGPMMMVGGEGLKGVVGTVFFGAERFQAEVTAEFAEKDNARALFENMNMMKSMFLLSRDTQPIAKGFIVRLEQTNVRITLTLNESDMKGMKRAFGSGGF